MSNHNFFQVLFDKIVSVYFSWKIYLYFSIGVPFQRVCACVCLALEMANPGY